MIRQQFEDGAIRYIVALDSEVALARRLNAIIQARVVDELSGNAITSGITVGPEGAALARPAARLNVASRIASGGIVGLTGIPVTLFPMLDTQSYDVGLRVRASGYLPRTIIVPLGPESTFPDTFSPVQLGDFTLHRAPVVLRGNTIERTPTGTVIATPNARVRITGIWRTMPSASAVAPPAPADLVAIDTPLAADRSSASTTLRTVTLTPDLSADKTLLVPAYQSAATLRLSNRENLSVGDVLVIDADNISQREHVVVSGIDGSPNPSHAATITLAYPLSSSHGVGTICRVATVSSPGAPETLAADALPGDQTLLCSSVTGFGSAGFLEVSGGSGAPEYHWMRPYDVLSDADGHYRLPPLSRVAQVEVEATHGGSTPVTHIVGPQYPAREQHLDFLFI